MISCASASCPWGGNAWPSVGAIAERLVHIAFHAVADIAVGDFIEEQVESVPIGRIGAMTAKQVVLQRIRDAEREMLLREFMERGEKIFTGTVKRLTAAVVVNAPLAAAAGTDAATAATAAAEPPEEPPGTRVRSHGLWVVKKAEFSVEEPMANSSRLVFPTLT